MKIASRIVGLLWLSPVTILVWCFYVLPLMWRDIRFVGWQEFGIARFRLVSNESWYAHAWRDWAGSALPCAIILRRDLALGETSRTLRHELQHCRQMFWFGALYYPCYALASLALWIYGTVGNRDVHAYYDNPFEVDARRAAGQPVKIPRSRWRDGPGDRNPWW